MKLVLIVFFYFFSSLSFAEKSPRKGWKKLYKKVFPTAYSYEVLKVKDPISANPINLSVFRIFSAEKNTLGFAREIATTTGCNSACLPLSYTSFYSSKGDFIDVLSRGGLTKINHTPFSKEDHSNLNLILSLNPPVFLNVKHPKEMTDAISGETLKDYKGFVVKGAAYSTLRIHLYNQQTISEIKKSLQKTENK